MWKRKAETKDGHWNESGDLNTKQSRYIIQDDPLCGVALMKSICRTDSEIESSLSIGGRST